MANYEDGTVNDVIDSLGEELTGGTSAVGTDIADAIMAAIGGAVGAAAVTIASTDAASFADDAKEAAALIVTGSDPLDVKLTQDDVVRMIATSPDAPTNTIDTSAIADDFAVVLSGGTDKVTTGGGSDTVMFRGGNATIGTGAGEDTIVLANGGGGDVKNANVDIDAGQGDDNVIVTDTFVGNASIDGGDGFDRVTFTGQSMNDAKASFGKPTADGFSLSAGDANLNLTNIDIVGFDADADGSLDTATVLATTQGESLVARLYTVALGRSVLDGAAGTQADTQLSGIQWWMDNYGSSSDLAQIASQFIGTAEFQAQMEGLNTLQIIGKMMDNVGITNAGVNTADTLAMQVDTGAMTLGQAAETIAMSLDTTNVIGLLGDQYVIDGPGVA